MLLAFEVVWVTKFQDVVEMTLIKREKKKEKMIITFYLPQMHAKKPVIQSEPGISIVSIPSVNRKHVITNRISKLEGVEK